MSKLQFFVGLALAVILLASPAKAQQVEWRGGGYLTSPSQACIDDGYDEKNYVSVRFRPKGFGSNGSQTRLGIFHPLFFATSYAREGTFSKSFKAVQGGGTSAGTFLYDAKLKVTQTPAKLVESTEVVRLVGQIQAYGGTQGCTFDFDFNLSKRP